MKAVVLGDVERTTSFFDRILDECWIDFDDPEEQTSRPDIVFVCGTSGEIQKQIGQFSQSLVCVLGDKKTTLPFGDVFISLSAPTKQVIELIKAAAKSKLKKEQSGIVYSYNQCTLQNNTLVHPNGSIALSDVESLILGMLLQTPGKLLRREIILNTLGDRTDSSLKKLDVFIYHLRQKVSQTEGLIEIETIQGLGFAIRTPLSVTRESSEKNEYNGIVFLRDRGQIFYGEQLLTEHHLTQSEADVFAMLLRGKGKRYNQERILHEISDEIETNQEGKKIVDVYISHIRRKLGIWRNLISTEFGDGYALDVVGLRRQLDIEKEKDGLYKKPPRIFTTQSFEFGVLIETLEESTYRGNYILYVSSTIDEKKTVLKIVQSSHPDKTQVFVASGSMYVPEEKTSIRDAMKRFEGHTFHPEKVGQYLAFDQDNQDDLLDRCPKELSGIEDIEKVLQVISLPENVGSYIYYARIHSNADWPRTYIAIERIPDFDTPIIISVAVLENRLKKRVRYMSSNDVVNRYGSRRISKIPTTTVFQNKSRELTGRTTRTECPPNLVNGVRSIEEIIRAFTNPAYFGEYIYSGTIEAPKVVLETETALNPHLVISRKGNDLTIKVIGGVYYSGEGRVRREVKVLKLEVEDLKTIGDLKVKKGIFDANMKKQFSLKGVPITRSISQKKEEEKMPVQTPISLEDIEIAFASNTIPPEYKNFTLKGAEGEKGVVAFMSAECTVQFTVQDATGAFAIVSFEELKKLVESKKFIIVKKEVFLVTTDEQSLLEVLDGYKNEIYKEGVYVMKFRSRTYVCSIVKKNGKITFSVQSQDFSLQEFLQKYGQKVRFSVLVRER